MRVYGIPIYNFGELSREAQEAVIERARDADALLCLEDDIDYFKSDYLPARGIEGAKISFDLFSRYSCTFSYDGLDIEKIFSFVNPKKYKKLEQFLGCFYSDGNSLLKISFYAGDLPDELHDLAEDFFQDCEYFYEDLCGKILHTMQAEYDHFFSFEHWAEMAFINNWEYLENGELFYENKFKPKQN